MSRADEPAYPASGRMIDHDTIEYFTAGGLTLREHFAGLIYVQFLHGATLPPGIDATEQLAFVATRACEASDALIAALAAKEK